MPYRLSWRNIQFMSQVQYTTSGKFLQDRYKIFCGRKYDPKITFSQTAYSKTAKIIILKA